MASLMIQEDPAEYEANVENEIKQKKDKIRKAIVEFLWELIINKQGPKTSNVQMVSSVINN